MSESTYKVQGSRVYGNGKSYNVNNKITALELCNTLNEYEKCTVEYNELEQKFDKIQKGIIQLQMSLKITQEDLDKIKTELNI